VQGCRKVRMVWEYSSAWVKEKHALRESHP
jgi:hypothetical protein